MEELGRALARWLLDAGVIDDITGASLEAGWFRTSRQSLFGSSAPPLRTSIAESSLPKIDSPPVPVIVPAATPWRARLEPIARAARAAFERARARFAQYDRARRWRLGAVALLSAGALLAWIVASSVGGATTLPEADDDAGFDDPVPTADLSAVTAWPPPALTALPEAEPEAAAPPVDDAPRAATPPSHEPRARAKPRKSATGTDRSESKERRRSKLIDPYR
jgi:hypothetical protein